MIPRGLIIALCVGVAAGGFFGLFFVNINNDNLLEFVEGTSLSIVTDKHDFEIGEEIIIKIINSGSVPLTFSDASYGLKITSLAGRELYSPIAAQVISILEPKEEITMVWDQIKNDGEQALSGRYKITSSAIDVEKNVIQKSITINIIK